MMKTKRTDRASNAPGRVDLNRMETNALTYSRSMRRHNARAITSLPAGKSVPIFASGLLREDAVRSGRLRFSFEMMETAELIMNPINVRVMAYLVPMLALERFQGSLDILNRSFMGEAPFEGEEPIPFIETAAFGAHGSNAIYKYLGLHGREDQLVNTAFLEAYNQIQNFRRKNRSPKLSLRTRLQSDLAEAFWLHEQFKHVVPSFDQAAIDGEVAVNIAQGIMPVSVQSGEQLKLGTASSSPAFIYLDAANAVKQGSTIGGPSAVTGPAAVNEVEGLIAEMQQNGITISLSNIELAKKTAAFAQMRKRYNGHSDDWIIDLLMQGVSISDQAFKHPMLIGERSTIFGMSKRYATDSGNLDESAVNGATSIDLSIQVPRVPMGGVIMIIAEITPEQLFERQTDPFLVASSVDDFPDALRDTLDQEKVMIVPNQYVDVLHTEADATFGYAPNNFMWNITAPRVGGKYLRPTTNTTFDEDRQRIWSGETIDPTLAEDFYLCTALHQKPFAVTTGDNFEVVTVGELFIEGNTQFGTPLLEASDDYDTIMSKAPVEKIDLSEEEEE
jgi:hypothetical protein